MSFCFRSADANYGREDTTGRAERILLAPFSTRLTQSVGNSPSPLANDTETLGDPASIAFHRTPIHINRPGQTSLDYEDTIDGSLH